jgi:hypothetical protein
MERFISTDFFRDLQKTSKTGVVVTEDILKTEYDEFVTYIFSESKKTIDRETYHNALVYTRTELSGFQFFMCYQEKNDYVSVFLCKAGELLDRQMELVKRQMEMMHKHPNLPKPIGKWTGKTTIVLIALIYAIKNLINNGEVTYKSLQEGFEYMFEVKLGNISDRFDEIVSKKKTEICHFEILIINLKSAIDNRIKRK